VLGVFLVRFFLNEKIAMEIGVINLVLINELGNDDYQIL
jgi:hypothetical protein